MKLISGPKEIDYSLRRQGYECHFMEVAGRKQWFAIHENEVRAIFDNKLTLAEIKDTKWESLDDLRAKLLECRVKLEEVKHGFSNPFLRGAVSGVGGAGAPESGYGLG